MDEDREGGFRFGLGSETEADEGRGSDGPEPRVPEYSGREPLTREDVEGEPAPPDRIEPGTPSLESVVFVVLGALATLAAFAHMFPFL